MIATLDILFKGIMLGLIVSVPLGPIGIILINRTIKRGLLSGLFSGLGLSVGDLVLAIVAALGFTIVIGFIREEKFVLGVISGIAIIIIGIKVFFSNPVKDFRRRDKSSKSLWRDFYSVFILAVTNPYTVLIFVAFFSGFPVRHDIDREMIPVILVPGIFIGTMGWWSTLSWFVNRFKDKFGLRTIVRINKIAGFIIILIGVIVLFTLFSTDYISSIA
ncbi:MAG TPA: LysE family transporter [Bacteroidales bacterium]|nr:LysE family transporter [Bacteroidales bacterium]